MIHKEDQNRRRRKLCEGVCDICHKEPANIPFDGVNYGYRCWDEFWREYRRRAENVKRAKQKKAEAIKKLKEKAISNFLRNRKNG